MNYSQPDLAGLTDEMMRAFALMRQTWQLHAALPGLDESHLEVLVALAQGSRRITQLAEDLGSDLSTVSRRITRLVALGLVAKTAGPQDRRVQVAQLTASGTQALEGVLETRRRMMEGVLGTWAGDDLAALRALLTRMNDEVSAHCLP